MGSGTLELFSRPRQKRAGFKAFNLRRCFSLRTLRFDGLYSLSTWNNSSLLLSAMELFYCMVRIIKLIKFSKKLTLDKRRSHSILTQFFHLHAVIPETLPHHVCRSCARLISFSWKCVSFAIFPSFYSHFPGKEQTFSGAKRKDTCYFAVAVAVAVNVVHRSSTWHSLAATEMLTQSA